MAVFVRILRLAMLFFNVYDSYKVLKHPPPSTQNKGRPSLRAMSQRKRDMKGCLAVWIVWSCFITYERFAEAIVSLFIPFYDEFKSLAMLFLIVTRARGAEPIYLHIIRPFLKPYTSTIDQLLDFAHVVGDVVLGLAALPFVYVIQWWQRRFGTEPESLDTETEVSSSPLSPVPSAKGRPPLNRAGTSKSVKGSTNTPPRPRQSVPKRSSCPTNQKKPSQPKAPHAPPANEPIENSSAFHDPPTTDNALIDGLPQVDEWRQYPAFPSAYPPTPLTKQTQITAATVIPTSSLPLSISEEPAQQHFRPSLLPPHNDLNPSYAGDLSDDSNTRGVQPDEIEQITISVMDVDGADSPDELMDVEDEYESEDEFNVTLRTPDPPLRILTSLEPPAHFSKQLSPLSLPTSALTTTTGNGSSLRTPSTESSVTSDPPVLRPTQTGHKRALQSTSSATRLRTSRVAIRGTSIKVARSARSPVKRGPTMQKRQPRPFQNVTSLTLEKVGSPEPENETSFKTTSSHDSDQLASKRRRVSTPTKTLLAPEPTRHRIAHAPSSTTRPIVVQRLSTNHPPTRLRTKTTAKLATLSSREGSGIQEDSAPVSRKI